MKKYMFILLVILIIPLNIQAEILTYEKEYTYNASELDSKLSSRTIAIGQIKRLIIEELGVYIESKTEVDKSIVTKDKISSFAAGIISTKILHEKWDGHRYWVKIKAKVDTKSLLKNIQTASKDQYLSLKRLETNTAEALKEIENIKEQLKTGENIEKLAKQYDERIDIIGEYSKNVSERTKIKNYYCSTEFGRKGFRYYELGNYKQATECLNKSLEIYPVDPTVLLALSDIYRKLDQPEKVIECYDRMIEIWKSDLKESADFKRGGGNSFPVLEEALYRRRADTYFKMGKYKMAAEDYIRFYKESYEYYNVNGKVNILAKTANCFSLEGVILEFIAAKQGKVALDIADCLLREKVYPDFMYYFKGIIYYYSYSPSYSGLAKEMFKEAAAMGNYKAAKELCEIYNINCEMINVREKHK